MSNGTKPSHSDISLFLKIGVPVFIVWLISWYVITRPLGFCVDQAGNMGASFGALNALFSGLAFAGIVSTIIVQSRHFIAQSRQFRVERFEDKFFQLLQFHNNSKEKLYFDSKSGQRINGLLVLNEFQKERETGFLHHQASQDSDRIKTFVEDRFFQGNLYIYFRTLYIILEYIDQSGIDDKDFYVRIVYSQRHVWEWTALIAYGLTEYGTDKRYGKSMVELVNSHHFLRGYPEPKDNPLPAWIREIFQEGLKFPLDTDRKAK